MQFQSPIVAVAGTAMSLAASQNADAVLRADLQGQIDDLRSRLEAASSEASSLRSQLSAVVSSYSSLSRDVAAIRSSMGSMSTDMDSMKESAQQACPLVHSMRKQKSSEEIMEHCGYAEDCYIFEHLIVLANTYKVAAEAITSCGDPPEDEDSEGSGDDL